MTSKLQTSCLFEILPDDLFRLCLQFLSFNDIGIFDNSITNHALRASYLSTIKGFMIEDLLEEDFTKPVITWLCSRGFVSRLIWLNELTQEGIELISNCRSILEILNFSNCENMTISLCEEIPHCPNLKYLIFDRCESLTEEGLVSILTRNPHVNSLDLMNLEFLGNDFLSFLADNVPNLHSLSLFGNDEISDDILPFLIRMKLKSTDLRATEISEVTILGLMDAFPDIEYITFDFFHISSATMISYFRLVFRSLGSEDLDIPLIIAHQLYEASQSRYRLTSYLLISQ
jgi:hypothetical protein